MNAALKQRLLALAERHEELDRLLAEPGVSSDAARWRALTREHARLAPVAAGMAALASAEREQEHARALLDDAELGALAREDLTRLDIAIAAREAELELALLPPDPHAGGALYLEIRAGTGGDEAALFAGDLARMYLRHAERRGWRVEILSSNPGEHGGYKELVARVEGGGAWRALRYESGTHRVQRVPATEAQGRIHTSAATVAVLPEMAEIEQIELREGDLKVDTFRASGAGGQHVNKTDSAIRITHLPSGIVVECQDERSQHKNRARALALLQARLLDRERSAQAAQQAAVRKLQVGSGDRSQRIRTYNFPQGRVTDHRINLTLYRLQDVIEGDFGELSDALLRADVAEQLQHLAQPA
ncbi:peptide chain release factor 1 [Metallibacterium sp.]|uniref:peptide chain release factor 1 n=1 Tax=Metallibacterium sp. TaxID=2940281 RepID=UPI00261B23BB|nr:peptide chain release factor 1 [Metallibacterium sp.]